MKNKNINNLFYLMLLAEKYNYPVVTDVDRNGNKFIGILFPRN